MDLKKDIQVQTCFVFHFTVFGTFYHVVFSYPPKIIHMQHPSMETQTFINAKFLRTTSLNKHQIIQEKPSSPCTATYTFLGGYLPPSPPSVPPPPPSILSLPCLAPTYQLFAQDMANLLFKFCFISEGLHSTS